MSEETNTALATRLWNKRVRILILALDAFVGGTIGGAASALVALGIKPEVFNFAEGFMDLVKMAIGCGFVSAAAYLRQRPDAPPPQPPTEPPTAP